MHSRVRGAMGSQIPFFCDIGTMPSSDSDPGDGGGRAGPSWFSVMVRAAEEDAAGLPEASLMNREPVWLLSSSSRRSCRIPFNRC